MQHFEAFTDLRIGSKGIGDSGDESVWPSFTDIMTVIVMIFLIALVVILIRNVELVQQLRSTMEAERQAAEIARTTEIQRESLAVKLDELEQQLTDLRINLLKSEEERGQANQKINRQAETIDSLNQDVSRLIQVRQGLLAANQQLTDSRDSLQLSLSETREDLESMLEKQSNLNQSLSSTVQELNALRSDFERQARELELEKSRFSRAQIDLEAQRGRVRQSEETVARLEGEYGLLKQKYDRLIRPARSAAGKYVVDIRFFREAEQLIIEHKVPGEGKYRRLSRQQLEIRLDALKAEHPRTLYTKIIIPEKSGLSYNEAWSFTNQILNKYDYYYQN